MSVSVVDEAILRAVEDIALTPETVEFVIQLSERNDSAERQDALLRERADVEKRLAKLVQVLETTDGDVATVTARIRELEARRAANATELANALPVPRLPQPVIEDRLSEWRRLLRPSTTQARAVIQRLVAGRITFTPVGDCYEFDAPTRVDKLFSGIVLSKAVWQRSAGKGIEKIRPEDVTGPDYYAEADYGAVLERAARQVALKGVRPQRDSNPCFGLERATSWASGRWGHEEALTGAPGAQPEHPMIAGPSTIAKRTERPR